jgi:hypothetical protein
MGDFVALLLTYHVLELILHDAKEPEMMQEYEQFRTRHLGVDEQRDVHGHVFGLAICSLRAARE